MPDVNARAIPMLTLWVRGTNLPTLDPALDECTPRWTSSKSIRRERPTVYKYVYVYIYIYIYIYIYKLIDR